MNAGTKIFLVLLRVAIGWHFFYEGIYKISSERAGAQPFTAEFYLRASKGPAADLFQRAIDDPDGVARLKDGRATMALDERCQQLIDFYDFKDQLDVPVAGANGAGRTMQLDQVAQMNAKRDELRESVRAALDDELFRQRLADYERLLDRVHDDSKKLTAPYSVERNQADEAKINSIRNELLAVVTGPLDQLDATARRLRVRAAGQDVDQMALGAPPRRHSQSHLVDLATQWGLAIVGFCLMVGLFPRLACLGAIGFLTMFYMSWPPWPGIPEPPVAEGHYMIVNKNLIELLAVFVLLTVPTGRWAGLSSFVQYFVTDPLRRREEAAVPIPPDPRLVERIAPRRAPTSGPQPSGEDLSL